MGMTAGGCHVQRAEGPHTLVRFWIPSSRGGRLSSGCQDTLPRGRGVIQQVGVSHTFEGGKSKIRMWADSAPAEASFWFAHVLTLSSQGREWREKPAHSGLIFQGHKSHGDLCP